MIYKISANIINLIMQIVSLFMKSKELRVRSLTVQTSNFILPSFFKKNLMKEIDFIYLNPTSLTKGIEGAKLQLILSHEGMLVNQVAKF